MCEKEINYPADWFKTWFDGNYIDVYNHRNLDEAASFMDHWLIWDRLSPGDACLDLGCGAGRYSALLAQRNLQVIGIDLSIALLRLAQEELASSLNPIFVQADMRSLPLSGSFSLVTCLFTSFGYFDSDEENDRVLCQVAEILKPGGLFVLDHLNPPVVIRKVMREPTTVKSSKKFLIKEERSVNRETKRVIKRIFLDDGKQVKTYFESVRMYDTSELKAMLDAVGLQPVHQPWGNYKGDPLGQSSPRMIFFCEKSV